MEQSGSLKFLFVINPISGGTTKTDWASTISDYFKALNHSIDFFLLDGKNDAASLEHWIGNLNPHRVVAVGGDGTISLVAKQILGTSIELGILPAGSANGMAKELDIPADINAALDIIVKGKSQCADVIYVNDQICLHLSDIGMNAQLIKYFEEGNLRGKLGYARVALKVLWKKQNMQVIIQTKDVEIKRNAFMIVLANASKYGFGAVINPEGDLYDGLFEVIIIRKLAISEFFKMWFRPQPFDPEKIELFHAKSVIIDTKHKVHFQVDGEYLGKVNKITATISPSQLHLLLPVADK
ncbi:MAG: YegS/Rv2252/BmrU family lipid kinase [Chitinophagaceae bacterium]